MASFVMLVIPLPGIHIQDLGIFTIFLTAFLIFTADFSRNYRKYRKLQYSKNIGKIGTIKISIASISPENIGKVAVNIGIIENSQILDNTPSRLIISSDSSALYVIATSYTRVGIMHYLPAPILCYSK